MCIYIYIYICMPTYLYLSPGREGVEGADVAAAARRAARGDALHGRK